MIRILAASMALTMSLYLPVMAQDGRPQMDESGQGAVLCMWSIYVGLNQGVEICALEPRASDADIADGITRIETFILEHTTQGITQATLDDHKARVLEQTKQFLPEQAPAMCNDIAAMRDALGDDVESRTRELLSVPREPVWNPCI